MNWNIIINVVKNRFNILGLVFLSLTFRAVRVNKKDICTSETLPGLSWWQTWRHFEQSDSHDDQLFILETLVNLLTEKWGLETWMKCLAESGASADLLQSSGPWMHHFDSLTENHLIMFKCWLDKLLTAGLFYSHELKHEF